MNIYIEKIRKSNQQQLVLALLLPTIVMVLTALILFILNIDPNYWGLPISTSMLLGNLILIYVFNMSKKELGLSYEKSTIFLHIFGFFLLLLVSIISTYTAGIKNINTLTRQVLYDILFFTVVALSDEIYFRGIIYRIIQVWDEKSAFIGSSLIYGFWTIPVGSFSLAIAFSLVLPLPIPVGAIERIILGLAFGVIRYTTKMIFLIIPYHIIINAQNSIIETNQAQIPILIGYILLLVVIGILLYVDDVIKKKQIQSKKKIESNS
jgi:hypothetical protein